MCRLLVRIADKPKHPDPAIDAGRSKRFDVIAVLPDGRKFGHYSKTEPYWLIVDIPGVPHDDPLVEDLFVTEAQVDSTANNPRFRMSFLDLDNPALSTALRRAADNDGVRKVEAITIPEAVFRAIRKEKPTARNPRIF